MKSAKNPAVEPYFAKKRQWQEEYAALRDVVLTTGLTEELKWMHPCYTLNGNNVVLIHGFKGFCALLFMKGALMKDPKKLLVQQTENVQAGRQMRFHSVAEIKKMKATIVAYIEEAVRVEKSGAKIKHKETKDFPMADEFKDELDRDANLKRAFEALTPGRQRGYLLYFSSAKQSKTRHERVMKNIDRILEGLGLED